MMATLLGGCGRIMEVDAPKMSKRVPFCPKILAPGDPEKRSLISVEDGQLVSSMAPAATVAEGIGQLVNVVTLGQVFLKSTGTLTTEQKKAVYKYALASSNAYRVRVGKPHSKIPGWTRAKRFENNLGSAADLYERRGPKGKKIIVIAFRGTEFTSLKDWLFGNFNIAYPGQFLEAQLLMKLVHQKYGSDVIIETTGHSLGGGLALSIARTHPGVSSIVFDSSPRLFSTNRYENRQVQIVESGEILTYIRALWHVIPPNSFSPVKTYKVNYLDGGLIGKHDMFALAEGLLADAAAFDPEARKLLSSLQR